MAIKYFLLVVEGSVSIRAVGPFSTTEAQDKEAKRIRDRLYKGGAIFWAEVEEGSLKVGDYSTAFFDEEGDYYPIDSRCRAYPKKGPFLDLFCMLPSGHAGDHAAYGLGVEPIATWPQEGRGGCSG